MSYVVITKIGNGLVFLLKDDGTEEGIPWEYETEFEAEDAALHHRLCIASGFQVVEIEI